MSKEKRIAAESTVAFVSIYEWGDPMTNPALSGVELPDIDLLNKFDVPAPRYTSYPTADRFKTDFTASDYEAALRDREKSA